MTGKEIFVAGVKLIGVYMLAEGIVALPSLLRLLEAHRDFADYRSSIMVLATIGLQLFVGVNLIGGAPWVMRQAKYDSIA